MNAPGLKFESTFFNGEMHGIGMLPCTGWSLTYIFLIGALITSIMGCTYKFESEYINNKKFGKESF